MEDRVLVEYNSKDLGTGCASANRSQLTSVRHFFLTGNPDGVLKSAKDGSKIPIEIKATKAKKIPLKVSTQLQVYMALYNAKQGLLICKLPGRDLKHDLLDYDETVLLKIVKHYIRFLLPSLVKKKVTRLTLHETETLTQALFPK